MARARLRARHSMRIFKIRMRLWSRIFGPRESLLYRFAQFRSCTQLYLGKKRLPVKNFPRSKTRACGAFAARLPRRTRRSRANLRGDMDSRRNIANKPIPCGFLQHQQISPKRQIYETHLRLRRAFTSTLRVRCEARATSRMRRIEQSHCFFRAAVVIRLQCMSIRDCTLRRRHFDTRRAAWRRGERRQQRRRPRSGVRRSRVCRS